MNNSFKHNKILSALPEPEYQRISARLTPVQLSLKQILYEPNQQIEKLYFPTEGIISLILVMKDGSTTETGVVGRDGMTGTLEFIGKGIPKQYLVQAKGTALSIDVQVLRDEFNRGETLQKLLLNYSFKLFEQVSQVCACNNHHTIKQRTARWLLMLDDRTEGETLLITQHLLSKMLGVRRPGVTEVAKNIQQQGIIDYHRGKIKIIDRPALEAIACECYRILKL